MPQVAVATGAADLRAYPAQAAVLQIADVVRIEWLEETRPAGAGVELGRRAEQRQVTQAAVVGAGLLVVQQGAAERVLGAVIQQHLPFLGGEVLRFLGHLLGGQRGQVVPRGGYRHVIPPRLDRMVHAGTPASAGPDTGPPAWPPWARPPP